MSEKLTAQQILGRVLRHERKRAGWLALVDEWERMVQLDTGYDRTAKEAVEQGQEQVTLPTPVNVVNLSQRLLSGTPQTKVLPLEPGNEDSERQAEDVEKFLKAMWKRVGQITRRHILNDTILFALIRGRYAIEVKWVKQDLPKKKQDSSFPILIRALDPKEVGVHQGPLYTEWVYRKYKTSVSDVLSRWPSLRNAVSKQIQGILGRYDEGEDISDDVNVEVIDYWWIDCDSGDVWNAVLVEDSFVKEPDLTDYPDLPIVVGRGDYLPGLGDEYDGLSILHPLRGLWEYMCRLTSLMGTGLMWHFWPGILIYGGNEEINIGPGETTPMPMDGRVELVQIDPNVPLAQTVYQTLDQHVQQSAYPEVMYGKAPGDLQAGYGVSLLSDAAKGRIKNYQEGLEMGISQVNSLVLGIIEAFAPDEGVTIWGYDQRDKTKYHLTIDKKKIAGNYENEVSITPVIPSAMMQMQTLGIRLADAGYISTQTLLDNFIDVPVPSDETNRIRNEELLKSDEMRGWRMRQAAMRWQPEKWREILATDPASHTLLEAIPGYHWTMEGELERDDMVSPAALPDNSPAGAGGALTQGPGGPPMPQPMPQPGPGGSPMGPGGPVPPQGPPPGPPPVQPGMVMTGPDGAGGPVPPAMQGLMTPDMMGMSPQANPLGFASLMGMPMSPGDELTRLAGQIPPGE